MNLFFQAFFVVDTNVKRKYSYIQLVLRKEFFSDCILSGVNYFMYLSVGSINSSNILMNNMTCQNLQTREIVFTKLNFNTALLRDPLRLRLFLSPIFTFSTE